MRQQKGMAPRPGGGGFPFKSRGRLPEPSFVALILLQLNLKIQIHSSGSSALSLPAQPRSPQHVTPILIRQVFSDRYHFLFEAQFKHP